MLTDLQTAKLTHYFNMLDFDRNGIIEKKDFTGIAENLCILWGMHETHPSWIKTHHAFAAMWENFRASVEHAHPDQASLSEWIEFGDKYLVNGSDEFFDQYVLSVTRDIFDCFDSNHDGYIQLNEYIDLFMAYHIQVRYSAKCFIKLDLNGDDLLSKEELLSAVSEFFRSSNPEAPGNWLYGFFDQN